MNTFYNKINCCLYFLILLFSAFFVMSCHSEKNKIRKAMEKIIGKNIEFPKFSTMKLMGYDIEIPDSIWQGVKVVVYIPPIFCRSCNIENMENWKVCMDEIGVDGNVNFIFIFHTKEIEELTEAIREYNFNYPVFYDTTGMFIKKNILLTHPLFFTFLLNKKNEIILVGDPSMNKELWQLYKKEIKFINGKNEP